MATFKEFVNAGAFLNTAFAGVDNQFFGASQAPALATPTLDLPTRTLQGKVDRINYTENPISVHLNSGSVWNMTKRQWDYLTATNKQPRVGSRVQIETYLDGTIKSVDVTHAPPTPPVLGEERPPRRARPLPF